MESEMARGMSREDAERIAYATINKRRDEEEGELEEE